MIPQTHCLHSVPTAATTAGLLLLIPAQGHPLRATSTQPPRSLNAEIQSCRPCFENLAVAPLPLTSRSLLLPCELRSPRDLSRPPDRPSPPPWSVHHTPAHANSRLLFSGVSWASPPRRNQAALQAELGIPSWLPRTWCQSLWKVVIICLPPAVPCKAVNS